MNDTSPKTSRSLVAALLLTSCVCAATTSAQEGPWRSLFNGKDLTGWTPKIRGHALGENPGNTFRVKDGLLQVRYDGYSAFDSKFGHLFFNQEFESYRLRLEYRFVGDQCKGGPGWAFRNSGVMVHGQPAATMNKNQDFPVSIEVQLLGGREQGNRPTANLCTPGTHVVFDGKLLKRHCTNSRSQTYRGDRWVRAEILVDGERITHFVEGKVVMTYTRPQLDPRHGEAKALLADGRKKLLTKGTISLQSESHPVDFRKIEIQELRRNQPMPSPVENQADIKVPAGFVAQTVYEVPQAQGSWVSLAVADKGRMIACNQYGNLFRITLGKPAKVEALKTDVGRAQGLLYAFDSLYVMGRQKKKSGLFRLTDTTGDDQFDKVEHLMQMPVGGEHHAHAIVLSPDGKSLYICAGNMTGLPKPGFTSSRQPRDFRGDHIVDRMPDARGHNTGGKPIGGWVAKVSPDGKTRELISNGYRNQYDIAFNPEGELFTYDSDMEWDIGAAWYRPTRVCHVVSGSEFGWRYGTGKWPAYFADSLSGTLDIGPGSPTGITFGTGAKFPAKYQRALFICDWSYGIIYAVHLTPKGASYTATKETFATAAPFPVTDIVIHDDGAMYFAVGGRGARSTLYRVSYRGDAATAPLGQRKDAGHELRKLRHELEAHHRPSADAVAKAWPHLGHADRHIRFAARIAIENQPVDSWQDRVLAAEPSRAMVHGMLALARHGNASLRGKMLAQLQRVDASKLGTEEKLELLRAYGLVLARTKGTDGGDLDGIAGQLNAIYPDLDGNVNRELCRVLCHLDHPEVVAKTLRLQAEVPTQEEQMHYAYCLRMAKRGWTKDLRAKYLKWFNKALTFRGGASFLGFCKNIRKDAIKRMPAGVRTALGDLVTKEPVAKKVVTSDPNRAFVKMWTVAELVGPLEKKKSGHDFARGRRMFGVAACARCHRFAGEGGAVAPDLTGLGGRFGVREILEAIIEPSKVISDQYQATVFEMKNGDTIVGYVANYARGNAKIVEDMFEPNKFTNVKVSDIVSKSKSPISTMPPNLLMVLKREEIQDLVAYLRSGGNPKHPLFAK